MDIPDIKDKEDSVVVIIDVDGSWMSVTFRKDKESKRLIEEGIPFKGNSQDDIATSEPTLGELKEARTKAKMALEGDPRFSDFKVVMSEEILRTVMAEKIEWGLPGYRQCRLTLTSKRIIATRGSLSPLYKIQLPMLKLHHR